VQTFHYAVDFNNIILHINYTDEFERNTSRFPNNRENDSGKVSVIETAKNWPVYFSRIFAVSVCMTGTCAHSSRTQSY